MHPISYIFLGACVVWFLMAKLCTVLPPRLNPTDAFKMLAGTGTILGIAMAVIEKDMMKALFATAIPMILGSLLFFLIAKWRELKRPESLAN